jgi:hypothetical protein
MRPSQWRPTGWNACIRRCDMDEESKKYLRENFTPHPDNNYPVCGEGIFDWIVVVWVKEKWFSARDYDYTISMKLDEFKKVLGMNNKIEED